MFPLYDTIPSLRKPVVNYMIVITNVLVFLYELTLFWDPELLQEFFYTFGFVPERMFYAFLSYRFSHICLSMVGGRI